MDQRNHYVDVWMYGNATPVRFPWAMLSYDNTTDVFTIRDATTQEAIATYTRARVLAIRECAHGDEETASQEQQDAAEKAFDVLYALQFEAFTPAQIAALPPDEAQHIIRAARRKFHYDPPRFTTRQHKPGNI